MMRRYLIVVCVIVLLCTFEVSAAARRTSGIPGPATKEPERFAFIVGNARYRLQNSTLDDLPDACTEVMQFRQALLGMGWRADHLYPLVKPVAAGETSEDMIAAAVCNKTGHELERALAAFTNMLLINENNPYGVVYYAGHGAQSNDEFYAFGVDAVIDFQAEMAILRQHTDYEVFSRPPTVDGEGPTAVNLTHLVSRVNGPRGKALLMIIDACRDNPVLDQFLAQPQSAALLTDDERLRLSIGYIANRRPDKYDAILNNVMVMFAGRPGRAVPSGTGQAPNWFWHQLSMYLKDPANLRANVPTFVTDFQSRAIDAQRLIPRYDQQIPQHIGSMTSTPVFCFQGCPQPLSVYPNEKVEVISDRPAADRHASTARRKRAIVSANNPYHLRRVSVQSVPDPAPDPAPEAVATSAAARPVNLDVFYCAGDALETSRKAAARTFAEEIRRLAPRELSIANTFIDQIRLRSLDINANLALAQPKTGTSLVLVKSNPASAAWQEKLGAGFDKTYMDDVTKGFIRAYFCTGFSTSQRPRPLVYAQVAHADQVPQAKMYLEELRTRLPELKFVDGVEAVDDRHPGATHVPDTTQIRCYTTEQCRQSNLLAERLRQHVRQPVNVVKMRRPTTSASANPVIELWFGRNEMAGWEPPAGQ
jgi:hypothetical protein